MSAHVARVTQLSAGIALVFGTHAADAIDRPSGGPAVAVTSCLDDGGPGTLRSVLAGAVANTTIDMAGLTCSTITLTQGELSVNNPGIRFVGPAPDVPNGAPKLTIDAGYRGRAFNHAGDPTGAPTYFIDLRIANGTVYNSVYSAFGGCVSGFSGVYAINTVFDNCVANGSMAAGGAVFAINRVTLRHSTITHSRAIASTQQGSQATGRLAIGGAIYGASDIHVYDSTISGNTARLGANGNNAPNTYAAAGAIVTAMADFGQAIIISGSTISGNQSDQRAGGILAFGTLTISNSTISGNSAAFAGAADAHGAVVTLRNSTIAFNTATAVGGFYAPGAGGTFTCDSTIISNNSAGSTQFAADLAHPAGALTVQGANNLITSWDASFTFASPPLTADPKLLPLANNGGPTMTHAIPHDSPALDAGSNVAALPSDQRGYNYPRGVNGRADIGAYEWLERIFADGFE